MMFLIHTFLVWTALTALSAATSEFSLKGDPCAGHDSCRSKASPKTCSCEPECHEYGTCCQDVEARPGAPNATYACYDRRPVTPVFVRRTCSEDFRGHVADRLACHDDDEDEMDVRNNLLVTSRTSKVTYWNVHCAACNNELKSDLVYWNIEVFCPRHDRVDREVIRTNLTFDEDKRRWGLTIDGEFLNCAVRYAPPPSVNEVKLCTANMISSCPEDYSNDKVSSKCSQYHAERKARNSDLYFKNIHCAICNNADVKELECPGMAGPDDPVEESDFGDMVEEVFADGEWLEKKYQCSRGFAYDPTRERCRRSRVKVQQATAVVNSGHGYGKQSLAIVLALLPFLL